MKTTTIYRINETDRTIDIAQSVQNDEESIHGAVLNTRTYTFDEVMNQHKMFREHTEPFDTFRDRLHSALRIGRSIDVSTDDMIARFVAEYGENIFFRGFVSMTMEHFSLSSGRIVIAAGDYTFNVFRESDNCLLTVLAEIGQLVHKNKWTVCECGFCHKLFPGTEGEICCRSADCIEAQKQQKEKIIEESTQEYSAIKKDYDSFVRRYKGYLDVAEIDRFHPDDYDEFMQAKQDRMEKMTALKKKLIRNGLPSAELYELGKQYKAEIKALTEGILDKYGFDVTAVAKIKKPKRKGKG